MAKAGESALANQVGLLRAQVAEFMRLPHPGCPASDLQRQIHELQTQTAVMAEKLLGSEESQERQERGLSELRDEVRESQLALREEVHQSRQETQGQLERGQENGQKRTDSLQKQISDNQASLQGQITANHTALLREFSIRDRQWLVLLVGLIVTAIARPWLEAAGAALLKLVPGG